MKRILSFVCSFLLTVAVASAVSVHGADKNAYQQKTFVLQGESIAVNSSTTNPITGGGYKLYDLPEGFLVVHGVVMDIMPTSTNLAAAADAGVIFSIGTASNALGNGATAATETNLATAVLTGYTSGVTRAQAQITGATAVRIDGSATAADVYLNVYTTNALSATGASSVSVDGEVTVTYSVLGDD